MTTVESQIYEFLRKGGKEFKALSCAIMVMERLLFEEKKSIYDIQVTKDIYPEVVKLMGAGRQASPGISPGRRGSAGNRRRHRYGRKSSESPVRICTPQET